MAAIAHFNSIDCHRHHGHHMTKFSLTYMPTAYLRV